jgi:glycosyltransferase involved in cell wall biosynthesis
VESYLEAHRVLIRAFGIAEHFVSRQRVLVVTGEPLKAQMAGPAIRAWEIAKALAPEHDVRLVSTAGSSTSHPDFGVEYVYGQKLIDATAWADVIVFQGFLLEAAPWLKNSSKIVVADIYDPMHLEQLEQARDLGPGGREMAVRETTRALNEQIARADFMLCASDKQRDFWLGQLAGQGRVNPAVYDQDETLDALLAVVPFGIADDEPVQRRHAIKGTVEGIGPDDKVILWGGGIYNWFDPLTLIEAVDRLRDKHPEVRLFFMGLKHPNPGVPDMRIAWETRELADRLGLTGTHVFFNEGWVPYEERADYLLDADVGVSTHFQHIETAFSFRTRILDYLWASLPIVATSGDTFGTLIAEHGLGRVVHPEDVDELVRGLEEMLYDDAAIAEVRANVRAFAGSYRWSGVLRPLIEFCRAPRRAADLAVQRGESRIRLHVAPPPPPISIRGDLALLRQYLEAGGMREVARRAGGRVRRVAGMATRS